MDPNVIAALVAALQASPVTAKASASPVSVTRGKAKAAAKVAAPLTDRTYIKAEASRTAHGRPAFLFTDSNGGTYVVPADVAQACKTLLK